MSLRVRRIDTVPAFDALAPVWAELAREGGHTSPFLSHDWFSCCWQALPADRRPEVLLVEDGTSPVAMLPLMAWTERLRGLHVRCLGFLESPDTPVADVVRVGEAMPVVSAILDHLATRPDWDLLVLRKIPSNSSTLKALEAALPGCFGWRRAGTLAAPYVAIEGDWAAFWNGTSQRFKKTCRNIQNRLERAGRVSVEEHREVDPESLIFQEAVDVSARSWKADRELAIATMPGMRRFFAELTRRAARNGWLSLWLLRLDGRAIAMEYQLRAGGSVHALRADFDGALRDLSPGSALNLAIVRALFAERAGVHEYDMGPGLNEYKLRWAGGRHETVELRIYRGRPYGRLLQALETVVMPVARRLREGLR